MLGDRLEKSRPIEKETQGHIEDDGDRLVVAVAGGQKSPLPESLNRGFIKQRDRLFDFYRADDVALEFATQENSGVQTAGIGRQVPWRSFRALFNEAFC